MLEPKVRQIAPSTLLFQTAGSELIAVWICGQDPTPETWEHYLVLWLIDQDRFSSQPERFQNAYADVVLRLCSSGLLSRDLADPALTRAGRIWIDHFCATHF